MQLLLLHSINHKYASSVLFHMVEVALALIEYMAFTLMSTCNGQCNGWNATVNINSYVQCLETSTIGSANLAGMHDMSSEINVLAYYANVIQTEENESVCIT